MIDELESTELTPLNKINTCWLSCGVGNWFEKSNFGYSTSCSRSTRLLSNSIIV